jgi:hypothetical protein
LAIIGPLLPSFPAPSHALHSGLDARMHSVQPSFIPPKQEEEKKKKVRKKENKRKRKRKKNYHIKNPIYAQTLNFFWTVIIGTMKLFYFISFSFIVYNYCYFIHTFLWAIH